MGLGRREFLKFAAIALGGHAAQRLGLVTINGDYYINDRLGLGFIKPSGWQFDAFRDFTSLVEGQIVQGVAPEDEGEFLRDHTSNLVVAISKYAHDLPKFGPAITIFKEDGPDYAGLGKRSLESICADGIAAYPSLLKSYEITDAPAPLLLSKCRALQFKARWIFEHKKIEPVEVESQSLLIDQGTALYTINLYDSPATGETAHREFREFTASLHIA